MATLLNLLRKYSQIDCDTLDAQVAQEYGPFVDCTSNQAIALFELSKTSAEGRLHYDALIKEAVAQAEKEFKALRDGISLEEFVVEILMVKLQLLILPSVTGFVHLQTNPKLSYSKAGTCKNAKRLVQIFKNLAPEEDQKRLCIKVPASWEGLQACRILEEEGIATLATTMFSMEQAALAADAQCTYIAPYINELRVHFDAEFKDEQKAFAFCLESQAYFKTNNSRTKVLAASFTSVEEALQLSGIHHLTLSPALLGELAATDADSDEENVLQSNLAKTETPSIGGKKTYEHIVRDESKWRLAFTRSGFGVSEGKLVQAICYFSDFQEKLEALDESFVAYMYHKGQFPVTTALERVVDEDISELGSR